MVESGIDLLMVCRQGAADVDRMRGQLERLRQCGAAESAQADIRGKMDARASMLAQERVAACRLCDMLTEPECTVLYRYYVLGQTQGEIVTAMHYSTGYYKRAKSSGISLAASITGERLLRILPEWLREP